jgi:hypothetical protein
MFLTTYKDAQKGSEAGADDIKTVVEIITNEKGQKVRVTKRFKLAKKAVRVNKRVEARRKWKKFGECAGLPPGPEKVITTVAEELSAVQTRAQTRRQRRAARRMQFCLRSCAETAASWVTGLSSAHSRVRLRPQAWTRQTLVATIRLAHLPLASIRRLAVA